MNRKKKINQIHKARMKKANAKKNGAGKNKPRYISKAERAKMEEEQQQEVVVAESGESAALEAQ
jgi:hypothetical protein